MGLHITDTRNEYCISKMTREVHSFDMSLDLIKYMSHKENDGNDNMDSVGEELEFYDTETDIHQEDQNNDFNEIDYNHQLLQNLLINKSVQDWNMEKTFKLISSRKKG